MPLRTATAEWKGSLTEGGGVVALGSGALSADYSFASRLDENPLVSPEELIAGAHASCFSMALSGQLSRNGFTVNRISTTAKVNLRRDDSGLNIVGVELSTEVDAPGLDEAKLQELANNAKTGCPVSKALAAIDIQLVAKLA